MNFRFIFYCLFFISCFMTNPAWAEKKDKAEEKDAEGTATLQLLPGQTPEQVIAACTEAAQRDAIERAFGKAVSEITDGTLDIKDGETSSTFKQQSRADLRGEWLGYKDDKVPVPEVKVINGQIFYTVTVYGRVRKITEAKTEISYIIHNYAGIETTEFEQKGDPRTQRIYVDFQSPASGNVVIYLLDETDNKAYLLLPYQKDERSAFPVLKGQKYTFFNPAKDALARNLNLTTKKPFDQFQLCILFSPNDINSLIDQRGQRRKLSSANLSDFNDWLFKARNQDRKLVVRQETITLRNTTIE